MSLGFEPEPLRSETRFHADTVKKAVALAQQLEQKRRETLSLEQVGQLADELNLDPQLLQQALVQVSAEEARRAAMQVQTPVTAQKQRQLRTAWILLVISLLLAMPLLLLFGYSTVSVPAPLTPPVAVQVQEATPPVAAPPLTPPAPPSPGR
jgi:hypothetical protein